MRINDVALIIAPPVNLIFCHLPNEQNRVYDNVLFFTKYMYNCIRAK